MMKKRNDASMANGYVDAFKAKGFFSVAQIEVTGLGGRKEIYFLGENGDGKSLILMSLILAFKGHFIADESDLKETGKVLDLVRMNPSALLSGKDSEKRAYQFRGDAQKPTGQSIYLENLLAYGVHRSRNDSDKSSQYGFMTLFDSDQYLISPERFLMNLYTRELEKQAQRTVDAPSISLEVAKDIITDLVEKNVEVHVSSSGVQYIERGTPLRFSQLSEGYKSVITWTCDMVARFSEKQPDVASIQDFEGVVLVDEISLHLHPRWEKQIVKKLREWFPKVQFLFTTHSPVTILGASDDAVFYRVYKENGQTKVSEPYFKENWQELMANSVLTSPLFGLDNARMENPSKSVQGLDTSDDYLSSRIHQKVSERLAREKSEGKKAYFSEADIDAMIEQAMNEELS